MTNTESNPTEASKCAVKPVQLVLLFLLFAGLALFQAWMDSNSYFVNVGTDPYYHLTFSKYISNPGLYQRDPVFHHSFYQSHALIAYPLFLYLLHLATQSLSFFQALNLFQVVFSVLYLSGATFFLYKFTHRLWPSVLVACLSARQTPVYPTEQWGTLSAALVIPGTFFLVFSPLLFWGWLQFQDKPRQKRIVFFLLGCLGNLHPLSWYTMTLSMLFAQLVQGRFKRPAIVDSMICGTLAVLPMIPFICSWLGTKKLSEMPAGHYQDALAGAYMMFPALNPDTLTTGLLPGILADFGWIALIIWATVSVWRQIPRAALYFALGCILLFLGSYALNQWVLVPHQLGLFIDGNRTLKFLALPVMLIVTLWLSSSQRTGLMLRAAMALFLVSVLNAQLLWADIRKSPLNVPGHLYTQWAAFTASRNPLDYVQLENIYQAGDWMKRHVKPSESRVFVSYHVSEAGHMLRALGQVSVTYAHADGGLIYQADPRHFVDWYQFDRMLSQVHDMEGYCSPTEIKLARRLKSTHIICPAWIVPKGLHAMYHNEMLKLWQL